MLRRLSAPRLATDWRLGLRSSLRFGADAAHVVPHNRSAKLYNLTFMHKASADFSTDCSVG